MNGTTSSLLFLDVDGPLIPFGADTYPTYQGVAVSSDAASHPLLWRLNPEHGPRLLALPCTIVWATSWMGDANDVIAPWLGLPELPVVTWPDPSEGEEDDGLHWKTRSLVEWAAGRSFVWVDDEIADADRVWVQANHPGHGLLHRVDRRVGLRDADFTTIARWLSSL